MKNALSILTVVTLVSVCAFGQKKQQSTDPTFPAWTKKTGARTEPKRTQTCSVNSRGAKADGVTNSTAAIQKMIDECSKSGGGIVKFEKGEYVTGALFLKNNVDLRVDE